MGLTFRNGKVDICLDSDTVETIAKCGMAISAAAGGTALAIGGTAAASSVAVPVAGAAAASATAYAAANATKGEGVDLIKHSQPFPEKKSTSADIKVGAFGGGNGSMSTEELRKLQVHQPNQSARIAAGFMQQEVRETIDPKIAAALVHFEEYKDVMQNLGFIKLEENQAYTTSKEYGCPTARMARTPVLER